jgi:single-stranded-DNA-specific exonuclease
MAARILHGRGLTADQIRSWLGPGRGPLHDPFRLLGMPAAIRCLLEARARRLPVLIYGDSDVDGISAVALLAEALRAAGMPAVPYVPDRREETLGVHFAALARLTAASGACLVITADCGIASAAELDRCRELGLDCLVTDHHLPSGPLPQAAAVIDPLQEGCAYPCKDLAGVGVAFKLAQALFQAVGLPSDRDRSLLDLVALGTIADMVPLTDENRALVWQGLSVLNQSPRPGIRALAECAGLRLGALTAVDLGVRLCPALNAAGRVDDRSLGYGLLSAGSAEEAEALAPLAVRRGHERQRLTEEAFWACRTRIEQAGSGPSEVLVVASLDSSQATVAGIVAGKLAAAYNLPALVLQVSAGVVRGTLRGTSALPVYDALRSCAGLLDQFGGHRQAAGFSTGEERLGDVVGQLRRHLALSRQTAHAAMTIRADAEVHARDIDWPLYDQLQVLEPHGVGNPRPLLLCRHMRVQEANRTAGDHLRLSLGRGSASISAIAYQHGDAARDLRRNQEVDLLFSLEQHDWDGECRLRLRVQHLSSDGTAAW